MSLSSAFLTSLPLRQQNTAWFNGKIGENCNSKLPRRYVAPQRRQNLVYPETNRTARYIQASIADYVERALLNKYKNQDIRRVSNSFRSALAGKSLQRDAGTPRHQKASSYIEGLDAQPFYDDFTKEFAWVAYLEENAVIIAEELKAATAKKDLETIGNNIWAPPVVEAANAYGPDWRTLVLQDHKWDPVNTKLFPETTKILRNSETPVPCVEAFFARQSPKTGIKLHTDDCNFILTMHLGLQVPQQKAWIEVGGERRYWEAGKGLLFNTSFFHQTMNESEDEDRLVLLLRVWHPELSPLEREAFEYLFDLIDNMGSHPDVLQAEKELKGKGGRAKASNRSSSSGRGFG